MLAAWGLAPVRSTAVAPPALDRLTGVQLCTLPRTQLGASTRIGGRRIAQATRSVLLAALA